MAASLIQHGTIRTTEAKAKELRRFVEKLISTAREGTLHARRRALAALGHDRDMFDDEGESLNQTVVQKLFEEIAPRYADRPGGYTRIIRLSERRIGDAGVQVLLQLVEEEAVSAEGAETGQSGRQRRAAKRRQAAEDAAQGQAQAQADQEPTDEAAPEQADDESPESEVQTETPDEDEKAD